MRLFRRILFPAVIALSVLPAGPARAEDEFPVRHIRGTVTDVADNHITVRTANRSVMVSVDKGTKYVGLVPSTAAEITSGTFIGTANVAGATSTATRALEVVVFPQSMAGAGEGDYPWDLPAGKRQSSMTNGTVVARRSAMMTNATVTGVNNGTSKTVTLQYKGGSKSVTIPPGIPIVRVVPGSKSLLKTGAHIFVKTAGGGSAAQFIAIGEQGVVPPM